MADFKQAVYKVLMFEGGLADDPDDKGGLTKYGISQRSYPSVDIRKLTREDAEVIYKRDFWDPLSLDLMPSQAVAERIFDCAVNQGINFASKTLQWALNAKGAELVIDGVVGPRTKTAFVLTKEFEADILAQIRQKRVERYQEIVRHDQSQEKFLKGWLRRV